MLSKLLETPDKICLIQLSELLALSDDPLLWDGKKHEELTADSNLNDISFLVDEQERELILDMARSAGLDISPRSTEFSTVFRSGLVNFSSYSSIGELLVEELRKFPISKVELPENRSQAARTVMRKLLKKKQSYQPEVPKIMLFEMILVALKNGSISSIEFSLLKDFQCHHNIEDFLFEELLERAEALNTEVSKTIAIVLE